jgi:hypothetical protein
VRALAPGTDLAKGPGMNRFTLLGLVAPVALAIFAGPITACTSGSNADSTFGLGPQAAYDACVASVAKPASLATGGAAATPQETAAKFRPDLVTVDGAKMEAALRDKLRQQMHTQLDQTRYYPTIQARCERLRPKPESTWADAAAPAPTSAGEGDRASQVSTTNNQIAGVDEADFIKNDTKYIYVANGDKLRIIDAYPATNAHEIASVTVPGTAKKLFVSNNHALVYSSVVPQSATGTGFGPAAGSAPAGPARAGGCSSYGYDCTFTGDGTATVLSIFDITNPAQPTLVRKLESSSSLVAARRIGDTVHTVLGEAPFDGSSFWSSYANFTSGTPTEADVAAAYDQLLAHNDDLIGKLTLGDVLPKLSDSLGGTPAKAMFQSDMPDGAAFTTVLSLDMANVAAATKAVTVISRPGAVFASADSLYMAVPHAQNSYYGGWFDGHSEPELTTVHKFSLGPSALATDYRGSGLVKGRVLNQFAMDDKNGKLRIATTTGHLPDPNVENTLSVLEEQTGALSVIGTIDHIAPGEDIRSVRFDGDRGYMVTFKKTDPLYVFDLADPRAPRTLGELKIPGFSVYMHLMDSSHLLTIGYDAADQGSFAWFTGVILQIFDVSNPAAPLLTHKETIGTRGSSSEALADHLAFNYFAPKNVLAIPMTICEGGNTTGGYGTDMTFSGLMVYDVTAATGFSLKGKVAHPNTTDGTGNTYDSIGCSNWWANATSEVKRSIIMDDYVFSVSGSRIKVNALADLATDVKVLPIE